MNLKNTLFASGAFGGMTANEQRLGRYIRDGEGHPDPAPVIKEEPVDPFDAAFAAAAADPSEAIPPATPAVEPPVVPAADPAAAPAAGDPPAPAPAAGDPPAPSPAPAAGDPPAPAAPEAPKPLSADDVLRQLSEKLNAPAPAAPAPAAPAAEPAPEYTPEEQGVLDEYAKNWPDIAQAETLRRRSEYAAMFKFIFNEVAQYVQPLREKVSAMGNTLHMGEVKAALPDYTEATEAEVSAWVDTQPAYLQEPFKQVMKNGTSEEVVDLIGRYRAATGAAPTVKAPAPVATPTVPAVPAAAPKTELSSAAKQAVESLAPVSGDRSAVPQGEDTQDFDSAFSRYATADG